MRVPGTLNYPSKKKLEKGYSAKPSLAKLLEKSGTVSTVAELEWV